MTNMRRTPGRLSTADDRHAVFRIAADMEEPLRHAAQMIFVLGMIDTRHNDEAAAIARIAIDAKCELDHVTESLRRLFRFVGK